MDVERKYLHTNWLFAFAPHGDIQSPRQARSLEFFPAVVPGSNLTDLQRLGLVQPETAADYEASFAPYKELDFLYRLEFTPGRLYDKRHRFLCFLGLDTICEIFLNGSALGRTENCFRRYRFDLGGALRAGKNQLLLLFRSPVQEARKRQQQFGMKFPAHLDSDFMFLRKPAYSFFWDWGPELPVSGIYRPVFLEAYNEARIADFHLRYTLNGRSVQGTIAVATAAVDSAELRARIGGHEFRLPHHGTNATIEFALQNVHLWYPNGAGEAYLYDFELTLEKGLLLDKKTHRIGFRTITLLQDPRADGRGRRFRLSVNGREIFCRGYNWIPVDSAIPRDAQRLYRGNLELARRGNVNMLRVWGGGYYEDDLFYRLCDQFGILVWQDGMFACSFYPDTDPGFVAEVSEELEDNIRRLRNYTSLALWCGENECHWGFEKWWVALRDRFPRLYGEKIYHEIFPAQLRLHDPDRIYLPGSPYSFGADPDPNAPHAGDTHFWALHSNCDDFTHYRQHTGSFISETGIQAMPDLRTALAIASPADHHLQSFVFDARNHYESPAKNERLLKFTGAVYRVSDDFKEAVHRSNLAQAAYLKYGVEHWRSLADDCGGVLIWQLNDCWPAISWSVVDSTLSPKASYYALRRAFGNDLVLFKQAHSMDFNPKIDGGGELVVVSERGGKKTGCVTLRIIHVEGEILAERRWPVQLQGRGVISLGQIQLPAYGEWRFVAVAEFVLFWNGEVAARNLYTGSRPKYMQLRRPKIRLQQAEAQRVIVSTDCFAAGLYLFHPDPGVVFDDNYFDLLPGESREVSASTAVRAGDVVPYAYF